MLQTRDRYPMPMRQPLVTWDPIPLARPCLDPDVSHMPALRRTAVILHYRLAAFEYALSPCGSLRAFIRLCALLGLLIGIPVLLIVPFIVVLVYALADITVALVEICKNILMGLLYVIGIVVICVTLLALLKRK